MQAPDKDYYATLGVGATAGKQEIRYAYHQLVRRYHPDTGAETADSAQFVEVQEAYEVLSDEERRCAYDRWRRSEGLDRIPALRLEVTPSHDVLPALDEAQLLYLYAEVLPGPQIRTQRLPLNLCLVLDHSTSMQGAKLEQLKEATWALIDELDARDVLSLVTFSDRASVVFSSFHGSDKAAMRAAVVNLCASGGTEIFQGLSKGLDLVALQKLGRSINHVILLTDGQTYGDEAQCVAAAKEAARSHVRITTLGIGTGWNDALLDEIARESSGVAAYIEKPEQMTAIFRQRIRSLQAVFTLHARFTLRHTRDVSLKEAFRVLPTVERLANEGGEISIGDLGSEAPTAFLFEWKVDAHSLGIHELFTLAIQGDIPALGLEGEKAEREVTVRFTDAAHAPRNALPEAIAKSIERVSAFRLEEKAALAVANGRPMDASQRLEQLATRLISLGERQLAHEALLEAHRVTTTGQLSALGRKRLKYGTRSLRQSGL